MKLFTRIHGALADRFNSVQYPRIAPADQFTADAGSRLRWKFSMPWYQRALLFMAGSFMVGIGFTLLGCLAFMIYIVAK